MSNNKFVQMPEMRTRDGVLPTAVALYEHHGMNRQARRLLGIPRGVVEPNVPARRTTDGSYVPAW